MECGSLSDALSEAEDIFCNGNLNLNDNLGRKIKYICCVNLIEEKDISMNDSFLYHQSQEFGF